jgi:uncharacterized membrane protein (DUF106 family)
MLEGFFSLLDKIFLPLTAFPPLISLIIFAALLTLLTTFLCRIFTRKNVQAELTRKIEEIRNMLAQAQKEGNKEKTESLLQELMKINNEYLKHSFKLLIISIAVISFFLPWFNFKYQGLAVANLPFALPFFGSKLNWIYWYAFASLIASWLLKKFTE